MIELNILHLENGYSKSYLFDFSSFIIRLNGGMEKGSIQSGQNIRFSTSSPSCATSFSRNSSLVPKSKAKIRDLVV